MIPDFTYEKLLWEEEDKPVIGVDEVGRGAWAGPLVVGAVVFPKNFHLRADSSSLKDLRDSKQLSTKKRRHFYSIIVQKCLGYAIGVTSPEIIDEEGLTQATHRAIEEALENLKRALSPTLPSNLFSSIEPKQVLVDAFPGINPDKYTPIKKGDERSLTIAAASIIAKEHRDEIMRRYAKEKEFGIYGWETNVGYATAKHRQAIARHGICALHRKRFIPAKLLP